MSEPRWSPSFQLRVLIPVIGVMAALMAITTSAVDRRVALQLQTEAAHRLLTSDAVFRHSLEQRSKNLLSRFRNVANEPRVKAISQLSDPKTLRDSFDRLLGELGADDLGADAVLLRAADGRVRASAARSAALALDDLAEQSDGSFRRALEGQAVADSVFVGGQLIDVVSLPVVVSGTIGSVLTFGAEIGDAVVRELRALTDCEVVFLTGGEVAISTLWQPEQRREFRDQRGEFLGRFDSEGRPIVLAGEHFLWRVGRFRSSAGRNALAYVLLSSYEQSLRSLQSTQDLLFWLRIIGLSLASLLVWVLIRRVTKPLRDLRDTAEAVGRGDFTRRVDVASGDECGQLAATFNRMTASLESSRDELEKTVETLESTQAQLVQREKLSAIGEFVAGVTHELNNPLTAVVGLSSLLQQLPLEETVRRCVDGIDDGARRCHKIVQGLLSFARQHPPERRPVDVNPLVEAALGILAYQLRTSNIEVVLALAPELPPVLADPHQLQQVFLNLLNNARQAIESHQPRGRLRVATEAVDGSVRVTFEDDGPGIPEEDQARIFNPFFTTKPVGEGTGLGLSISYGIVQEHGGTIRVSSRPGSGATFTIDLPAAADAAASEASAPARGPSAGAPPEGGKRVLVIDDEDLILDVVRQLLSPRGYQVDTARDGAAALRQLGRNSYDLTLCDWRMPGLTGQEVFEKLRARNPEAARRLVFMTGDVINERIRQFLEDHALVCLPKPFSAEQLLAVVDEGRWYR